jgi:hypothetical protein
MGGREESGAWLGGGGGNEAGHGYVEKGDEVGHGRDEGEEVDMGGGGTSAEGWRWGLVGGPEFTTGLF